MNAYYPIDKNEFESTRETSSRKLLHRGTTQLDNLKVHILSSSSPRDTVKSVLDLSDEIFGSSSSAKTHFSSFDEWQRRLSNPGSLLVYATIHSSSETVDPFSIQSAPDPATGFIFAHPRDEGPLPHQTFHIWLAGVSESARDKGVFATLMGEVERQAHSHGWKMLSISTFPERFARMFAVLKKQGWEIQSVMEGGAKVFMTKNIAT